MKTATPATTVEGHMIDLPAAYPDGSVRFHFRLERLERVVPADAVQVVVPESAVDGDVVWDGGDHVRVTGREGVFETP